MSSIQRPPNQFLQALPEAEFELLRPRLKSFEMVREAVLTEIGRGIGACLSAPCRRRFDRGQPFRGAGRRKSR